MTVQTLDERRDFIIPGHAQETLAFCAAHLFHAYEQAVQSKGFFAIALSGGSTPRALFQLLTSSPYKQRFSWDKIHLFWGDERNVPPDHTDSNYLMAMQAGFAHVGISQEHIHRMIAETDIEAHAKTYEELIQQELGNAGFDYICLGMGEDGHTASLFPGTKALQITDRLVVANHVPQKNTDRMTLTYPCIHQAKQVVLYVLGSAKQDMVREIFVERKGQYPVEKIGTKEHKALWIMDLDASALLPSKKT